MSGLRSMIVGFLRRRSGHPYGSTDVLCSMVRCSGGGHGPRLDFRDQRGIIAPVIALSMVVLLGFSALVTDIGLVYSVRRQMQNAVDMAALAGANQLLNDPQSFESLTMQQAISDKVASLATANGIGAGELEPVVFSYRNTSSLLNPTITVAAHREVSLLFASVLGFSSQRVRVEATSVVARVMPKGLWPWAVTQDSIVYDQQVALHVGARDAVNGNFMALDYLGQDRLRGGAQSYQYFIENLFYDVPPNVPPDSWWVPAQTGVMAGPTRQPVMRILSRPECDYDPDIRCPKIGLTPILRDRTWSEVSGKDMVEIVDFAVFRLEGIASGQGTGQDGVLGTFVHWAKGVGGVPIFDTDLTGVLGIRLLR